jgi:isoquinoline 1-oxidoreductase beta subunit
MSEQFIASRRMFLKLAGSTAGLVISGLSLPLSAKSSERPSLEFKLLTIHPDNTLTIYNSRSEMGQGIMTSLTQLLLDELDADWSQIREVKNSWADAERFGHQNTIGAISSLIGWMSHRQAGGKINLLLRQTAAKIWKVELDKVTTHKGELHNQQTGQTLNFGQLTVAAEGKSLAEKIELKSSEKFTLIGKSMPRVDSPDKVTGKAKFGIDQQLPNLKMAVVARSPVFGGTLISFDDKQAKKINGIIAIFAIPSGVAVVAKNYWQADKARKLLQIKWENGDFEQESDLSLQNTFIEQLNGEGKKVTDKGDASGGLVDDDKHLVADFTFPLVAHMTMEPMNCTVWHQGKKCEIWAPTQNPQDARTSAATTLNLDKSLVTVNVTLMGGGFGRRAQDDFVIEACEVAKQLNYPVKVVWSREDDLQHDYYRPPSCQRISASIVSGKIHAWQHKVATLSTSPYHFSIKDRNKDDGDWVAYGGSEQSLYQIDHFQCQTHLNKTPMPVGILRGISHGYINFACEVTIDELAERAGQDPFDFRLAHIKEPRAREILTLLKNKVAKLTLSKEQSIGIAFGHEKAPQGPYQYYNAVAVVVEKSASALKVGKIIMALDHGQVINPDGLLAQAQGSAIFALSMMFQQQITLKNGRVQQGNFDDYPVSRMGDEVDVEMHTLGNHDWPMGVGEKLQGTIQPAIANALYRASGQRVRSIPVNLAELV